MGRMKKARREMVAVNEMGRRIGESHPAARLTDHEVGLIFALAEEGMTTRAIAEKMETPAKTVWDILAGRRRGQAAAAWRPAVGVRPRKGCRRDAADPA